MCRGRPCALNVDTHADVIRRAGPRSYLPQSVPARINSIPTRRMFDEVSRAGSGHSADRVINSEDDADRKLASAAESYLCAAPLTFRALASPNRLIISPVEAQKVAKPPDLPRDVNKQGYPACGLLQSPAMTPRRLRTAVGHASGRSGRAAPRGRALVPAVARGGPRRGLPDPAAAAARTQRAKLGAEPRGNRAQA